jgi:DsbC/DsbD-like thiol-disulfide interchange protein/cytochrome c biogenesis protein CcdA
MVFRILFLFLFLGVATASPVRTEHVEAELVAERTAVKPGETVTVALRLKIIPHWHTYWRNPGDSGEPTRLEWRLPPGVTAGPIQWPAPWRLPAGPLMNFGYEDEVLHLVDIAVPASASGTVALAAHARWLVCNPERCIPEEGEVSLALPVGAGSASPWAGAIARTRAALPVKAQDLRLVATRGESGVELQIDPPPRMVAYFPFEQGKIHNAGAQVWDGKVLKIPKARQPVGAFTRVAGLLVMDRRAVEVDVPVAFSASALRGLAIAMLFAFTGGLILNLMPCVLPVLSIKILGFAGQSDRRVMRLHGALYGAGVVLSFLFFAGLLVLLQALGAQVGWGFQLQSPVFVAFLLALFLALALNLSGFFEFSFVMSSELKSSNRHADAFLTGVLAVAVASPCTAPFMGAALGYALASGPADAIVVFAALGIGMALPYVVLAWHPGWLRWLPRPGPWMARFKQLLAIPLYATVLWLGWVLALQAGLLASSSDWEKFSLQKVQQYGQQGKAVFVDYTAAWCVTCQVNKQLVLSRPDVEAALRASGMALLRADWTRRDEEITRALAALGRNGVPVYAIYRPGQETELLPELLTRDTVLTALGAAKETQK